MKQTTHTFMFNLMRERMARAPTRELGIAANLRQAKEIVLEACKSRQFILNILYVVYKACMATGPIAWPS